MAKLFIVNSNNQATWFSPQRGDRAGSYGAWLVSPSTVEASVQMPPWDMSLPDIYAMVAATDFPPGIAVDSIIDD
jgi:hypothetical protein